MTLEELKKDLLSKLNCPDWSTISYFKVKFFEKDSRVYSRRSFDDLFKYYSQIGATEKTLIKALYELNFTAKVCNGINKVVFFKVKGAPSFLKAEASNFGYLEPKDENIKDSKYTPTYLQQLLKNS